MIDIHIIQEIIGYIGLGLVVVSMLMTKMFLLRIINTIGSLFCIFYAFWIDAYPTFLLNICILIINIIQLIKIFTIKHEYEFYNISTSDILFKHFIKKYNKEIRKKHPNFEEDLSKINYIKVIYSNNDIVGILAAEKIENTLNVFIDFIDQKYVKRQTFDIMYNINIKKDNINYVNFSNINKKFYKYYLNKGFKIKERGLSYAL